MLRPLLLTALVQLGHGKTINEGVRRFNIFIRDRNTSLLPPDTRKVTHFAITSRSVQWLLLPCVTPVVPQAAYLAVMQNVSSSNRSGYDALRKVYRESAEGEERLRVLGV
jgi:puromycin-sensitive aminopeptidase